MEGEILKSTTKQTAGEHILPKFDKISRINFVWVICAQLQFQSSRSWNKQTNGCTAIREADEVLLKGVRRKHLPLPCFVQHSQRGASCPCCRFTAAVHPEVYSRITGTLRTRLSFATMRSTALTAFTGLALMTTVTAQGKVSIEFLAA